MYEWRRLIQTVVDEIDERIKRHDDDTLTLKSLSKKLGYSEFHTTRKFKEISGMLLGDYIRLRKLAFALIEVRDTKNKFLDIAVKHGFGSHESFTRAFKTAYGISPKDYRKNPLPVVLRTKISTFDRYFFGLGEIGMVKSTEDVKVYFITMPAHKFLHIKNYESNGYWDFWEKQDKIPGQDCDTICGLLDSIKGKLDGKDDV
ncbi:MAG: AraC family transcriptional regulator, partial [Treponema sp.]|nr:AraC family transcriptional regulator [Treponema sp.]